MDIKAVTEHIRRILTAPDVDLATISSKKVRKVLAESFGASVVKENKEAIDALIIEAFNRIATAAGATAPASQEAQSTVKTEPSSNAERQSASHAAQNGNGNGSVSAAVKAESSSNSKQRERDRVKQQQPEESDASEDGQDYASGSTSDEQKPSSKKPPYSSNIKQSPQKRKIEAVASGSFPASSPNVPLSMTTGLTDEEYARKLQEEFNNMAGLGGGRSTRGSGSRSSTTKKKKTSSSSKKSKAESSSSNGKYRSKAYIDDSDLEGEDRHRHASNGSGSEGDAAPPKKKKRKAPSGEGSGGGYNKELALSEPLQKVCGVATMSRPKIVKRLWEYIREHELQDPNKRSDIINDDLFREVFGVEKMTMFSMNKYLTKAVKPIDG